MNKHVIHIWNQEDQTYDEALADGAVIKHEIELIDPIYRDDKVKLINLYLNAYAAGLADAGLKLRNYKEALGYRLIELKPFTVEAEVLEWNRYTVTAYAESAEEAVKLVKQEGAVTFERSDVEFGVSSSDCDVTQRDEKVLP